MLKFQVDNNIDIVDDIYAWVNIKITDYYCDNVNALVYLKNFSNEPYICTELKRNPNVRFVRIPSYVGNENRNVENFVNEYKYLNLLHGLHINIKSICDDFVLYNKVNGYSIIVILMLANQVSHNVLNRIKLENIIMDNFNINNKLMFSADIDISLISSFKNYLIDYNYDKEFNEVDIFVNDENILFKSTNKTLVLDKMCLAKGKIYDNNEFNIFKLNFNNINNS